MPLDPDPAVFGDVISLLPSGVAIMQPLDGTDVEDLRLTLLTGDAWILFSAADLSIASVPYGETR